MHEFKKRINYLLKIYFPFILFNIITEYAIYNLLKNIYENQIIQIMKKNLEL